MKEHLTAFHVKTSLKITVAGLICIVINNLFDLNISYLSELYVFLIMVLFHGQVFRVGIQALVLTALSVVTTLLLTSLFIEMKVLYLLFVAMLLFTCLVLSGKYFLASLLSGIGCSLISYMAIYESVSIAFSSGGSMVVQLALAVFVSGFVDGYLWPHRSRPTFDLTLKTVFDDFSTLLNAYCARDKEGKRPRDSISVSLPTFASLIKLLERVRNESGDADFPEAYYTRIITFGRAVFLKTELLDEHLLADRMFLRDNRVAALLRRIFDGLSGEFRSLSSMVAGGDGQSDTAELQDALGSLHERYRTMHEVRGREDGYYEDLLDFGSILPLLEDISKMTKRIKDDMGLIRSGEYLTKKSERINHLPQVAELESRPFMNITQQTVRGAYKTVIIFFLLLLGEKAIGLPGGSQVAFYAVLFGIIPNLGQVYLKSEYGVAGILCGIFFSLICLLIISQIPHFLILLCLFSAGYFSAAYVANSDGDLAVAGLQAGLVIPYGLLFTTGPQVDLDTALTRFLALLSTAFIAILVHYLVWPVNPYNVLINKISQAVETCGKIVSVILLTDTDKKGRVDSLVRPLAAALPTSASLLHDAEYIIRQDELHSDEFIRIIDSIELMYADILTLKKAVYENPENELMIQYIRFMEPCYRRVTDLFERVSGQFKTNQAFADEIRDIAIDIGKRRTAFRESDRWRSFDPIEIENNVLLASTMDSLFQSVNNISSTITLTKGSETGEKLSPGISSA